MLDGDVHIENLNLDGSISVEAKGGKKELKDLTISDKNYVNFVPTDENEQDPRLRMRGFKAENAEDVIPIEIQ